jgi:hypothetical protein
MGPDGLDGGAAGAQPKRFIVATTSLRSTWVRINEAERPGR